MDGLDAAKIAELRQVIDSHLRSQNVYGQIRSIVQKAAVESSGEKRESSNTVINALKEKGVIEELIKSVRRPQNMASISAPSAGPRSATSASQLAGIPPVPSPFRRFLHLKILGGRAFVEHVSENRGGSDVDAQSFVLFVHFRNQRFRSRPVPCALEPAFDEALLMDLQNPESSQLVDLATLLTLDAKIHIVLARVTKGRATELVASYDIEWRNVLAGSGGSLSIPAELLGAGPQAKMRVPVGVLDLRLDIIPPPESDVPAEDIARGLKATDQRRQDMQRQFFQYSKVWWEEYVDINPTFKNRLVKIYAEDEWGGHRPVCSYVVPLRAGRLLDSPRHAARFVSLIPYTKVEAVGSGSGAGRAEIWHHFHTFLSLRRGDCEDHAVLLCSLLLGFGLDAYVCIGTVKDNSGNERDHLWVITRIRPGTSRSRVIFWESLTGQRYPHRFTPPESGQDGKNPSGSSSSSSSSPSSTSSSDPAAPKYGVVGCVFNHRKFYANKQINDAVAHTNFTFEDSRLWKGMDSEILGGMEHQESVPLCPPTISVPTLEASLERSLMVMITSMRRNELRLATRWDEQLSYLLTPALAAYEMERLTGASFGNDEFQQSIKRNVPEGHTFRGYPVVVNSQSPEKVLEMFKKAQIASDIMRTRGDEVNFALRVKIVTYPEDVCAVWVMLAVKFKPTANA